MAPEEITAAVGEVGVVRELVTPGPEAGFAEVFAYGEHMASQHQLPKLMRMSRTFTDQQRHDFIDGVVHGYPWDTNSPKATVALIQGLPNDLEGLVLYDGVLMRFTQQHAREPARVVKFAQEFTALSGVEDPRNGVRIGLQRALGSDLPEALRIAATYPDDWQAALYEELGWRSSSGGAVWPQDALALARTLDLGDRCVFLHGAVRGWGLRVLPGLTPSTDALTELVGAVPQECESAAWQGLGRGIAILYPQPQEAERWLTVAPQGAASRSMRAACESLGTHNGDGSTNIWELLDEQPSPPGG